MPIRKKLTLAFIGDIVGRPGRSMVKEHLKKLREEFGVDFVIANYENASHGFGLTSKNAQELFGAGIDVMTGGNHSFDKKEIAPLFETMELLRPHNYPDAMPGTGVKTYEVNGSRLGVVNVMGHYTMPMADNPFICAQKAVEGLKEEGAEVIFMDVHAEASSEKRAMMMMFQGEVSGIIGTHTHVGTDDFQIANGTAYMSDIGLTGCRDNIIGMEAKIPLQRFLTGIGGHFNVPDKCKKILQVAIMNLEDGKCVSAKKIKIFDDGRRLESEAWLEK
ncbi:MAG: TIGR00282 family metallophosphoesterase [Sulfurimonadaceae bacterium]